MESFNSVEKFSDLSPDAKLRTILRDPDTALEALGPEPSNPKAVELQKELKTLLIKIVPPELKEHLNEDELTEILQNPDEYAFFLMHGLSEQYSDRSVSGRVYKSGESERLTEHIATKKPDTYSAKELIAHITHERNIEKDEWVPVSMRIESDFRETLSPGTTAILKFENGKLDIYKTVYRGRRKLLTEQETKVEDPVEQLTLFLAFASDIKIALDRKTHDDDLLMKDQMRTYVYGEL